LKNGLRAKHDVSLKQAIAKIACLGGPAAACCRVAEVENGQDGLFQQAAIEPIRKPRGSMDPARDVVLGSAPNNNGSYDHSEPRSDNPKKIP
jgi:hypothetical protein